jgi:hypothetical protein
MLLQSPIRCGGCGVLDIFGLQAPDVPLQVIIVEYLPFVPTLSAVNITFDILTATI